MNNPFFSVIVPVYNVEKFLPFCIESVLSQTYSDYEILLIDDGSKDTSSMICDDYCRRYPEKIRVQHKTNQGLISARRAGLKSAVGQYVCFLDSDDCWSKNTLERLYEVIQRTDSDVVIYQWKKIDENGILIKDSTSESFFPTGGIQKKAVFEKMLSTAGLNSLCIKCCRLELFDRDKDYSEYYQYQNGEDMLQSLPVLYCANSFYYLNEALYFYRSNPSSITHNYQNGQYRTQNIMRPMLYGYIEKMGLDTQDNKNLFFQTYLNSVWDDIVALFRGVPSYTERLGALQELRSYEFVVQAQAYIHAVKLPPRCRIGLSLFYGENDNKMAAFMRKYVFLLDIKCWAVSALSRAKSLRLRGV